MKCHDYMILSIGTYFFNHWLAAITVTSNLVSWPLIGCNISLWWPSFLVFDLLRCQIISYLWMLCGTHWRGEKGASGGLWKRWHSQYVCAQLLVWHIRYSSTRNVKHGEIVWLCTLHNVQKANNEPKHCYFCLIVCTAPIPPCAFDARHLARKLINPRWKSWIWCGNLQHWVPASIVLL